MCISSLCGQKSHEQFRACGHAIPRRAEQIKRVRALRNPFLIDRDVQSKTSRAIGLSAPISINQTTKSDSTGSIKSHESRLKVAQTHTLWCCVHFSSRVRFDDIDLACKEENMFGSQHLHMAKNCSRSSQNQEIDHFQARESPVSLLYTTLYISSLPSVFDLTCKKRARHQAYVNQKGYMSSSRKGHDRQETRVKK